MARSDESRDLPLQGIDLGAEDEMRRIQDPGHGRIYVGPYISQVSFEVDEGYFHGGRCYAGSAGGSRIEPTLGER
jgi:hypothetical protein